MRRERTCPDCGATLPADAPRGLCPNCLMAAALPGTSPPSHEATGGFEPATGGFEPAGPGVLDTIAQSIGPVPRVLLRDTAPGETPGPVVRPDATGADPSIRYRIDGEIARGGMGAILKGRDPDLGRDVAIKVLRADLRDKADLVRRFVEEAQIGGQLQHPGVVPIYELGTFADRRPFFSMKLVKGQTLADLLAARSEPADDLPRFLSIFAVISQTMAYSHTRGVIHRDLKPSNVMVGSFGEVQVMDWGLARVLPRGGVAADARAGQEPPAETLITTAGSGSDRDLSRAGSIMGTPSYMPPEQARGETDRIDERADVFALGSILCEVLTARPAFTGRSATEILRRAADGDTDDALARLEGCGSEAELIGLAKDCLAVEPDDRPRDAKVVAERITAYLAGVQERVQAAERERAVAVARAIEERRRRKVQLALAASVLALTTLGGLSTTYYLQQRAERARQEIELDAATDRVVGRAETLRDQARENREDLSRWQVALAAVEQAEAARHEGAAHRLLAVRTEVQAGLDSARRDEALLDRVVEIRSAEFDDPDGSITDRNYADAFREAGIDLATLPPAEAGAQIKARPTPVALALAAALDDWASIRRGRRANAAGASRLNDAARVADPDPWRNKLRATFDQSDKQLRLAELQALARTAKSHELGAISLQLLAVGLYTAGDRAGAVSVLRKAQAQHPGDVWVNYELGSVLGGGVDAEESIRFLSVARAIRPETAHQLAHALEQRGDSDAALSVFRHLREVRPGKESNLGCLGDLLKRKGLSQEAGEVYEAAAVSGRELIRLNPGSPEAHSSLARSLMRQHKLDEAIAELRTVKRLEPKYNFGWPGSVQIQLLEVQAGLNEQDYKLDLAIAYVEHNRAHELEAPNPRAAEPLFRQAFETYRTIQGPAGPMTLDLTNDLIKFLERTGRGAEAGSLFRDALSQARQPSGPDYRRMLSIIHQRAHSLDASKPGEAEPLFRQALEGYRKTEGPDGALTIDLTNDLASLLDRTGRSALADPMFRDALERARKRFGPTDTKTAGIMASWGLSLLRQGRWDAAEPVLRDSLAIREKGQPDDWSTFNARSQLGGSLLGQKKYAEAEALILSGYEGLKAREARIPLGGKPRLTEAAERVARLYEAWGEKGGAANGQAKLAQAERLAVAQVVYDQKRFAAATRLWAEALASDPKLGDDRQSQHRYNAARAAALAAAGQGEDAARLDASAKAKLRRQALDWLKAELAAWRKQLDSGPPQDRPTVGAKPNDWQQDTALAGLRDAAALAVLPADERKQWQALWADVDSLRAAPLVRLRDSSADLVDRLVKSKDPSRLFPSIDELSQRIETGGADGEAAARLLLRHGQDIAPHPNVKKLLDELAGLDKSALAARLLLKIAAARTTLSSQKRGYVAVGRVLVPDAKLDPELILAQMEILPEGYFAGEIGDLERPLVFRGEGYSSLEVPLKGKAVEEGLVYLGTVSLEPLAAGQTASVTGKVTLVDAKGAETPTVRLSLQIPPINSPHGGYAGRRRWPTPITVAVSKSGEFKATRLSPTDYSLSITAPGYVSQYRSLTLGPGETHDAETIVLERPRRIEISYRVASSPPFTKASPERQTVLGGDEFRADRQDSRVDLRFPQDDGPVRFQAVYGPCSIVDLGPGKLENFLEVDPTSAKFTDPRNALPQSGHVYLLDQKFLKHWVLFELEFDEKAPANRADH